MREIIHLKCQECGRFNYHTTKEKRAHPEKFEVRKYCKWCNKHTAHKESKL
jgi:large subunit ribosomal protein L33